MSFKTLQRIFPMDDSMAVIIDDRGDVWNWSPNLILVRPCNFFHPLNKLLFYFFSINFRIIDEYFLGVGDIHAPHRMVI